MFVTCQILRCPIGEYTRESTPFLIAVSLVTLLLVFVPEVVLMVPNLLFGKDRRRRIARSRSAWVHSARQERPG
jgi:hypothetical protein